MQGESLYVDFFTDLMQDGDLIVFGGDCLKQLLFGLFSVEVLASSWMDQQVEDCFFFV
jgi:hypothetical protein